MATAGPTFLSWTTDTTTGYFIRDTTRVDLQGAAFTAELVDVDILAGGIESDGFPTQVLWGDGWRWGRRRVLRGPAAHLLSYTGFRQFQLSLSRHFVPERRPLPGERSKATRRIAGSIRVRRLR